MSLGEIDSIDLVKLECLGKSLAQPVKPGSLPCPQQPLGREQAPRT